MSKISGQDFQDTFKEYINEKRFSELAKLIETTQTKPADFIVRMGFKNYMDESQGKRVKLFYIMKLKEITGVKPDKNIIKQACEMTLKMDTPETLEALIKRIEIEKDIFKELLSVIQKTYADYVIEGKFIDISKLMELTETRPEEDTIHKGYESYLDEGKFISFAGLKKRTGVKPNPVMIQDMYRKYYFNFVRYKKISTEQSLDWMDRMRKLRKLSRIDPPEGIVIEEEPAQEMPATEENSQA